MVSRVAVTTGAPGSVAAFAPTLPTHAAGDRLTLFVTGKYDTTTTPTINQGWTLVHAYTGGTGSTGNDVGPVFIALYAKDATSSAETAPTVTPGATAPNSWEWVCASHRPGSGKVWADPISLLPGWSFGASDTSTTSPLTGAPTTQIGITDGDAMFAVGVIPTDLGSALGSVTYTQPSLSGGTKTTATSQYVENALGNDTAAVWVGWTGFTGTTTAAQAATVSLAVTSASNLSGAIMNISLREQDDPNPIRWIDDANFGGTAVASRTSVSFRPRASSRVYVVTWGENAAGAQGNPVDSDGTLTWTRLIDDGPFGPFNARFAVFESSDTGLTPATRTLTMGPASGTSQFAYAIWEVQGESVKQDAYGGIATGATASTGTLASAATNGNIVAIVAGHNRDTGTRIPTPSGWTELTKGAGGAGIFEFIGLFYRTDFTGTSATVDTSSDSTNSHVAGIIEWQVGAGVTTQQGAAALTATSTLTTGATREKVGAAALVATSTLNATGGGTSTAGATLSATSTLNAGATRVPQGAATLSAVSTLTAGATRVPQGSAAFSAVSTLSAAADRTVLPSATFTAVSTLSAAATVIGTQQAAAAFVAVSTLNAAGVRTTSGSAAFTATSTLNVVGVREKIGAATFTAVSTLTAGAERIVLPAAALVTVSTLNATGTGVGNQSATATLTTVSTLTTAGDRTTFPTAALTAVSTLTVGGLRTVLPTATLSAVSTLTVGGVRTALGAVAFVTVSDLSVTAGAQVAEADLTTVSTLSVTAGRTTFPAAALHATSTLTVGAFRVLPDTAALSTTSTLTVGAVRVQPGAVALHTTSTLLATPAASAATGALVAVSTLTVLAVREQFARVDMETTSTMFGTGEHVTPLEAELVTVSTLTVGAWQTQTGGAALVTVATLTADASVVPQFTTPTPPVRILRVGPNDRSLIAEGGRRVIRL